MATWSSGLTWDMPGATWLITPAGAQTSQAQSVSGEASVIIASTGGNTSQSQGAEGFGAIVGDGAAHTRQAQSSASSGGLIIAGDAADASAQSTAGMGGLVITGAGQSSHVQDANAHAALVFAAAGGTGQAFNRASAAGFESIRGSGTMSGIFQSASAVGHLIISGSVSSVSPVQDSRGGGWSTSAYRLGLMFDRLLRHPHRAVFDKAPASLPVIRFDRSYDGSLRWAIHDNTTLEVELGGVSTFHSLEDHTVFSLVGSIRAQGITLGIVNSEFSPLSAMVLVDDSGQPRSDRDPVLGYTSLLWVLLRSYTRELAVASYQVQQALRQMVLWQAEGYWLDYYGELYGIPREPGESDRSMQVRLPQEVTQGRVNGYAIEQAIKGSTGKDIEIREPWKLMFRLDESRLSDAHHLHDGHYSYHVIQPVARAPTDFIDVLRVIDRNRAAGVLVSAPVIEMPAALVPVTAESDYVVYSGCTDVHAQTVWLGGDAPLGLMRLDDYEFTFNHPMALYELRTYSNTVGAQGEQSPISPRNVAYASIALSDGVPLGDENAILSRGQMRYLFDPEPILSDSLVPSDYDVDAQVRRVERVTIDTRGGQVPADVDGTALAGQESVYVAWASAYDGVNTWVGPWNARSWLGWRLVGSRREDRPWAIGVSYFGAPPLSDMVLSDYEIAMNHPMVITETSA
jgi:hypothetical protein